MGKKKTNQFIHFKFIPFYFQWVIYSSDTWRIWWKTCACNFSSASWFRKLCLYALSAFLVLLAKHLISPFHHSSCPSILLPSVCYFLPDVRSVGLQIVLEMRAQQGFARRQNCASRLALLPFCVQNTNCIISCSVLQCANPCPSHFPLASSWSWGHVFMALPRSETNKDPWNALTPAYEFMLLLESRK